MVPWYIPLITFVVGVGLTWGFRGWIQRKKDKVEQELKERLDGVLK